MVEHSSKMLELLRNTMLTCCMQKLPIAGASCLSCSNSCSLCCFQASTFCACGQDRILGRPASCCCRCAFSCPNGKAGRPSSAGT
eukprot:834541-Pelagomonas_calceolata.AAC.1